MFSQSQYRTVRNIKCFLFLYESIYLFIFNSPDIYLVSSIWGYMVPSSSISRWWSLVVFTTSSVARAVRYPLFWPSYHLPVNMFITPRVLEAQLKVYCEKRLCWMLWCSWGTITMQIIGQWNYWVSQAFILKK